MNTEPLLQVKAEILADPASLDMDEYFSACGTRMCIAGRLAHNAGWRTTGIRHGKWMEHDSRGMIYTVEQVASMILGVPEREAQNLFHVIGWPLDLRFRYDMQVYAEAKAKIAAEMIDHFIASQFAREHEGSQMTWDPCFHVPQLKEEVEESPVEENETCAVV